VIVAFISPRKVFRVGEPECSDDWCITVAAAQRTEASSSVTWRVTLRISSRAQRVSQRELGAVVYLTDDRNRRLTPRPIRRRCRSTYESDRASPSMRSARSTFPGTPRTWALSSCTKADFR